MKSTLMLYRSRIDELSRFALSFEKNLRNWVDNPLGEYPQLPGGEFVQYIEDVHAWQESHYRLQDSMFHDGQTWDLTTGEHMLVIVDHEFVRFPGANSLDEWICNLIQALTTERSYEPPRIETSVGPFQVVAAWDEDEPGALEAWQQYLEETALQPLTHWV